MESGGAQDLRGELRADCSRCAGLCCVVPALTASADFAIDKAAGVPCPNLRDDFGCAIHHRLVPAGFSGCAAYDCFGAGQQVTGTTFGGEQWRHNPGAAPAMFAAFQVMQALHELLWYLCEAALLGAAGGATGLLAGAGGAALLTRVVPGLESATPPGVAAIALSVAIFVALAAGLAPALRASRLDPIEALRAE